MQEEHVLRRPHVTLSNVHKSFDERDVLKGIDLDIKKGEFVAIVGKSGCGKSTLLRLLAGLETYNDGSIQVNQQPLTNLNKHARLMFQDGRLLPWKRVLDNIHIGLSKHQKDKAVEALQH